MKSQGEDDAVLIGEAVDRYLAELDASGPAAAEAALEALTESQRRVAKKDIHLSLALRRDAARRRSADSAELNTPLP